MSTASSDYWLSKNSIYSSSSPSPSNSSHSNPWKLGFMYTEWASKASRSVIIPCRWVSGSPSLEGSSHLNFKGSE
jgi:hypothetical protein